MKLSRIALVLLLAGLAVLLYSQDSGSIEDLFDQVLHLDFHARLISDSGELLWQMENKAYTISGRTVDIRLEGGNVLAISRLTPYLDGDHVLLVAQGEVWYNRDRQQDIKYLSGMTSIPIRLGESALFFPLGVDRQLNDERSFIIEIEITVDRYSRLGNKQ